MYYEEKFINGVLHYRTSPCGEWSKAAGRKALAANALFSLTDEERAEVFGLFCRHCGANDHRCQCWNDE